MKISDQSYISLSALSEQPKTSTGATSANSDHPGGPKVEQDASSGERRSFEYPMASDQEVTARYKRASLKFNLRSKKAGRGGGRTGGGQGSQGSQGSKGSHGSNKHQNSKPAGGPNSPQDAADKGKTIGDIYKRGGFTPLPSNIAANVRSSFFSEGVRTLISLPLSVGEHLASSAITDRIYAQSKVPGAEIKNADGTKTTVDPSATAQQKLEARLEGAEIKTELMANNILFINEGADAKALGQDLNAPTDAHSRLAELERRMNAIEKVMEDIGKRYLVVYEPYKAAESSDAPTDESRMKNIEDRYAYMNRMTRVLIASKSAFLEGEE